MENYTKGEVKELEEPYPFSVDDSLQMRINQGSRIRNIMGFAMKKMGEKDVRQIAWNGSGPNVTKTITCAEIMKRKLKGLHQITRIRMKRIEEHWLPNMEGLEILKVNRDIPAVSILLSKDPLDTDQPGYQPPGNFESFWQDKKSKSANSGVRRPRSSRHTDTGGPDSGFRRRKRKGKQQDQQATRGDDAQREKEDRSKSEKTDISNMDT